MSTPIDIIANAIRESRPMAYPSPPKDIAEVAVTALADERIEDAAVTELAYEGWAMRLNEAEMREIIRIVVRAVRGAR